jgi:hypothetical protein
MNQSSTQFSRNFLIGVLCAGALMCALLSALTRPYGFEGHVALPQADAPIYMQYARAWAEGRPYQYNAGDAPTTGSTSHLYPLLLAVPYFLGARGDALVSAGFLLNAVTYLLTLFFLWDTSRRLAPRAAPLALLLCLLSGHTVYASLG